MGSPQAENTARPCWNTASPPLDAFLIVHALHWVATAKEPVMTTNKDDNPKGRIHQPNRADRKQAHERLQAQGDKDADELNPRNDRGTGNERTQAQGRGLDADRGSDNERNRPT